MSAATSSDKAARTTTERTSDRELVVKRRFDAPRNIVFRAWSDAGIFKRWWVPKSVPITMLSCELDVRTGGTYKLVFSHPAAPEPMTFFGRYIDVVPPSRIVWTNDEAGEAGQVTTVSFEESGGGTVVVIHELYPSKEALDEAIASGSINWNDETFGQLDAVLAERGGR